MQTYENGDEGAIESADGSIYVAADGHIHAGAVKHETREQALARRDRVMRAREATRLRIRRANRRETIRRWALTLATIFNTLAILDIKTGFMPW